MKPILLKFDGFFNYKEEEVIDFASLNEARLFGVFGKTGSGKSAILDAISFALFGKIDRLPKNDKKAYINTDTKKGFVSFTFEVFRANNYEQYTVIREFRIRQKRNGDTEPVNEVQLLDSDGNVLETKTTEVSKKIQDIINIKEDDYYKIISLPQGKFSEFLNQTEKDRVNFLKKIFDLEKYDISDQINAKRKGLTKDLENYEKNIISRLKENNQDEEVDINKYEEYVEQLNNTCNNINKIACDFQTISKKLEDEKTVLAEKNKKFEVDINNFKECKKLQVRKEEVSNNLKKIKDEVDFANKSEIINQIIPHYKNYINKENEEKTLSKSIKENIIMIKAHNDNFKDFTKYREDREVLLKKLEDLKLSHMKILELEKENKDGILQNNIKFVENKIKDSKDNLQKFTSKVSKIKKEKERVFDEISKVDKDIKSGEKTLEVLKEQEILTPFLYKLEKTGVCPLCGSKEQPSKIDSFLQKEFEEATKNLEDLEKTRVTKLLDFNKYIDDELGKKKDLKLSDGETLYIQYMSNLEMRLESVKNEIKIDESTLENNNKTLNTWLEKVRKFCDAENFIQYSKDVETKVKSIETEIKTKDKKYNEYIEEQEKLQKQQDKFNTLLNSVIVDKNKFFETYNNMVSENNINNFTETYSTAYSNEKIKLIKEKSQKLDDELKIIVSSIDKLYKEIGNLDFDKVNEEYNKTKDTLSSKEIEIKRLYEDKSRNEEKLKNLKVTLNYLHENYDAYTKLKTEHDNYTLLNRIVGSKKFVNHLINMRMKRLIDNTNIELSKITDNKYSIGVKDNTEFFVRENTNGKVFERDIKSLSGGETFLYSLCLSLALSRELQNSLGNKNEFYFIDEGFGTLDSEKLHMIYNMLSKLSNDMTIGLITHIPTLRNLIQNKILVGEDIDGNEISDGKRITVI